MHHAILASWIAPVAIFLPGRFVDQVLEGWMMRIGHQVTRSLPTARIESRVAPGRAHHVALPGKKLQVDGRRHQLELFEQLSSLLKFLAGFGSRHEYFFVLDRRVRV